MDIGLLFEKILSFYNTFLSFTVSFWGYDVHIASIIIFGVLIVCLIKIITF